MKSGCTLAFAAVALLGIETAEADVYRFQRDGFEIRLAVEDAGFEGPYPLKRGVVTATTGDGASAGTEFELAGDLEAAWVTDLDGNGRPEVVIWVRSFGSGGFGELTFLDFGPSAIAVRRLPPLSPEQQQGYAGHDRFAVAEETLVRSFPIYRETDANCCPSGGESEVVYAYDGNALTVSTFSVR